MKKIDQLRAEIDTIDEQLLRYFEKRMSVVNQIGDIKAKENLPIQDKSREKSMVRTLVNQADHKYEKYVGEFFEQIIEISKQAQRKKVRVAYVGIPGAFAEEAVIKYFGLGTDTIPLNRFAEAAEAVENGTADFAVLPIENSYSGSVFEAIEVIGKCYICAELALPIEQCLLGQPGTKLSEIERVYSHRHGILQCDKFLKGHPSWEKTTYYNTAAAAKFVADSKDKRLAAIASSYAAKKYGLEVLVPNINTSNNNYTRFVVLSKKLNDEGNKAVVYFRVKHEPGALYRALGHFADMNMNITHLESRPVSGSVFEYGFYADIMGDVSKLTESPDMFDFKILGRYEV